MFINEHLFPYKYERQIDTEIIRFVSSEQAFPWWIQNQPHSYWIKFVGIIQIQSFSVNKLENKLDQKMKVFLCILVISFATMQELVVAKRGHHFDSNMCCNVEKSEPDAAGFEVMKKNFEDCKKEMGLGTSCCVLKFQKRKTFMFGNLTWANSHFNRRWRRKERSWQIPLRCWVRFQENEHCKCSKSVEMSNFLSIKSDSLNKFHSKARC